MDGVYPCPRCGASVTAWRHNPATGRVFDADPYNPYRPHVCQPVTAALGRIADLMAAAVAEMDGVARERIAARPAATVAAARPGGTGSRPTPPRPATAPSQTTGPVAGGGAEPATREARGAGARNGQTVDV